MVLWPLCRRTVDGGPHGSTSVRSWVPSWCEERRDAVKINYAGYSFAISDDFLAAFGEDSERTPKDLRGERPVSLSTPLNNGYPIAIPTEEEATEALNEIIAHEKRLSEAPIA